jgi:uncharacterized SAM-binding protein YcdF (DUF218 family)
MARLEVASAQLIREARLGFVLSKIVETILSPSNVIALLGLLGLAALISRRRRFGVALLVLSTVLLATVGWSPLGPLLLQNLEDRFPIPSLPPEIAGIVMLGGAVDTHVTEDRGSVAVNDNGERITALVSLASRYPSARIILSGGAGHLLIAHPLTESEVGRRFLIDLGVPAERIEMEEMSRTTFENAAESLAIAKPKSGETWLLVTSAYNMPRAVASFRAVGFEVVPYPVDYRTRPADLRRPVATIVGGLELTDIAVHEWLGLLGYRLTGRTQSLLPSPDQ